YKRIIELKQCCAWIKNQTKLNIDICKWFFPFVFSGLALIFLYNSLYYPYFKDTIEFKNGVLTIRDYKEQNQNKHLAIIETNSSIADKTRVNPIGDWGTFGDFLGGTVNPLIGLISILLLFATWRLTSKTLDFTKEELKNSNDLLATQQFDTLFWGLMRNLENIENNIYKKNTLDNLYHAVFQDDLELVNILSSKRKLILENAEVSKYFICLYQILKNIDERIKGSSEGEKFNLQKNYVNILRSVLSTKVLQLLAVNSYEEFDMYRKYLEKYNFFEHMPFYIIGFEKALNFTLLFSLNYYNPNVFGLSKYYEKFLATSDLKLIFDNNITDLNKLFELISEKLDKSKSCTLNVGNNQFVKFYAILNNGKLNINEINNNIVEINVPGLFSKKVQLLPKEHLSFIVTEKGIEFDFSNRTYVINSFHPQVFFEKENPL
ncbi:TPA: putative phage abortive infection protein, partial [Acinetobacter baumannii]